jgi:hypothetical protein
MSRRQTFPLPARLLAELDRTARVFARRGVRLFVFGSVAETYPSSYRGADLDLGYTFSEQEDDRENLERELVRAVRNLPTVRPVDLVNFDTAGREFTGVARSKIVRLPVGEDE